MEKALADIRKKGRADSESDVLEAFRALLKKEDEMDERVLARIFGEGQGHEKLNCSLLSPERIFHRDQIKALCTHYRLRFLDARYYKGEIPYEAISRVKALQRDHKTELTGYKILAPAPMFDLRERDKDPLLFVPLSRDRFYLVHKWGNDLHPLRKLLVWPFRSFKTLLGFVAALALLVVMAVPEAVYLGPYDQNSLALRVIFFFYLFIAFAGLTALYGFSRLKNFNGSLWDSRFTD